MKWNDSFRDSGNENIISILMSLNTLSLVLFCGHQDLQILFTPQLSGPFMTASPQTVSLYTKSLHSLQKKKRTRNEERLRLFPLPCQVL